jgi:hypothetical protein
MRRDDRIRRRGYAALHSPFLADQRAPRTCSSRLAVA